MIRMSLKLPSKSNTYEVHIAPSLWRLIHGIVRKWNELAISGKAFWIGPSATVKTIEEEIAWHVASQEKREWKDGEHLTINIRLFAQPVDIDNSLKILLDGIEKSGRIKRDSQFRRLSVEHLPGKEPKVEIEIESY